MNKCRDRKSLGVGAKVLGTFVPGSESSLERKFLELSLPGAKVPVSESSWEQKFLELSLPGAKVPGNESSRERKFHTMVLSLLGAKVLRSESSIIHLNLQLWGRRQGEARAKAFPHYPFPSPPFAFILFLFPLLFLAFPPLPLEVDPYAPSPQLPSK